VSEQHSSTARAPLFKVEHTTEGRKFRRFLVDGYRDAFEPGFVYLLQAGPFFKIGRTKKLGRRIREVRLQLPFPVELVAWSWSSQYEQEEADLHRRFHKRRRNGEWFVLEDGDVEFITSLFDAQTRGTIEEWLGFPVHYIQETS
jgi:hypothetical protein